MKLKQKSLRIPQAPGRGHLSLIAGGPETAQQPGLGTSLKRHEKRQGTGTLEILAKTAAGQQQGHRSVG